MFWQLLCAHLVADFPLQPTWIVRNKRRVDVLLLHASIHFGVTAVLTYPASRQVWPALLALAGAHFAIDAGKNWLSIHRPGWVIWPYLVDQALHVVSLALLAAWLATERPGAVAALPPGAAVVASGFLAVTFVWRVTERILRSHLLAGPGESPAGSWLRLGYRALLLAALLLGWGLLAGQGVNIAAAPAAILLAYPNDQVGKQTLAADLGITTLVAAVVIGVTQNL